MMKNGFDFCAHFALFITNWSINTTTNVCVSMYQLTLLITELWGLHCMQCMVVIGFSYWTLCVILHMYNNNNMYVPVLLVHYRTVKI